MLYWFCGSYIFYCISNSKHLCMVGLCLNNVVLGLLTHLCSFMFAGGVPTEILIEVSAMYYCMYAWVHTLLYVYMY